MAGASCRPLAGPLLCALLPPLSPPAALLPPSCRLFYLSRPGFLLAPVASFKADPAVQHCLHLQLHFADVRSAKRNGGKIAMRVSHAIPIEKRTGEQAQGGMGGFML